MSLTLSKYEPLSPIGLLEQEEQLLRKRAEQLHPQRRVAAVELVERFLEQLDENVVDDSLLGPPWTKPRTPDP